MRLTSGLFLAAALCAGVAAVPTSSWAQSGSKAQAAKSADKSTAGNVDEFEENRKAHIAKSKENNAKKGAE